MKEFCEIGQRAFLPWLEKEWGIGFSRVVENVDIQGSPERTLARCVVEDGQGNRFLVEKFPWKKGRARESIARALILFRKQGLSQATGGIPATQGKCLLSFGEALFQVTPFLEGTPLPRPQWLMSGSRGQAMGDFLNRMGACAQISSKALEFPSFRLGPYIQKLAKEMAEHHPQRFRQYLPFIQFLDQGFMVAEKALPMGFCHGDFHPLNIIWEGGEIKGVIDWEFAGFKPLVYDAANLIGCAGIEHPEQGLVGPMALAFLHEIRRSPIMVPACREWFLEYVLALRFAWLSEWLRNEDEEMLENEAAFMAILLKYREDLRDSWNL